MTTQICTTVEQSERLLEAGVNPQTADMTYHHKNSRVPALEWELRCMPPVLRTSMNIDRLVSPRYKNINGTPMTGEEVFDKIWGKDIPTWSLSKLIEMMPKRIKHEFYDFSTLKSDTGYIVKYSCSSHLAIQFHRESIFDAMIDMIEWLIKNGHFDKKWLVEKGGDNETD